MTSYNHYSVRHSRKGPMVPKYVENVGVNLKHPPQNCFLISETTEESQHNREIISSNK
jgi:hypothetical protein